MIIFSIFSIGSILLIIGFIMQLFTINKKLDTLLYRTKKRNRRRIERVDCSEIERNRSR